MYETEEDRVDKASLFSKKFVFIEKSIFCPMPKKPIEQHRHCCLAPPAALLPPPSGASPGNLVLLVPLVNDNNILPDSYYF